MVDNETLIRPHEGPGPMRTERRSPILSPLDDRLSTAPPLVRLKEQPSQSPRPSPVSKRKASRVRGVALSAAALVMAVGGVVIGVRSGEDAAVEDAALENTAAETADSRDAAAVAPPTPVAPLGEPAVSAPAEPVAEVAALLGPSVVQVETNLGQGSGVVYADGFVMTNHHVVAGTSEVQVRLADGRLLPAELVGSDQRIDIAVLRIGPVVDLPVAQLAPAGSLQVGHMVVAIGSPFQLQQTVTSGVVSALNRPVPNDVGTANAMIQTDTAINPGNSGGALADRQGRVVGINTSGRTDGESNSNIGIGFAVPIQTALETADRLVAGASMQPGVLGIAPDPSPSSTDVGVLVAEVTAESPAQLAGIEVGDRIVSIDGLAVPSADTLGAIIQSRFEGETIELVVSSGGVERSVSVALG